MFAMALFWVQAAEAEVAPPKGWREALGSDEFKHREEGQTALLQWARQKPQDAKEWLYLRASEEADPEIRRRCMAALRELVLDEYQRDGEGYAGITMQVAPVAVPGDARPRFGVRAMQVVPGAPAAKAKLVVGDVIIGIGPQIWREATADKEFQTWVRSQKPGTKVTVKLLRENKVVEVAMVLERRPAGLEALMPFGVQPGEAAQLDQDAKESYFLGWLERHKARK